MFKFQRLRPLKSNTERRKRRKKENPFKLEVVLLESEMEDERMFGEG